MKILEVYKVGFMDWEVSLRHNGEATIYYFRAYTRSGALRKANSFVKEWGPDE